MPAAQILIRGDVQGVGYRAWARRTARALGIAGFARNLDDGRVEIFAEGSGNQIDALVLACASGPEHCLVDDVSHIARPARGATEFVIAVDASKPDEA